MSTDGSGQGGGPDHREAGDAPGQGREGPANLLGEMRELRRQARADRHAYWFPLVLFGLLTCAAAPLYLRPGPEPPGAGVIKGGPPLPVLGGLPGYAVHRYLGYYWLAALLGGVLLTLLWYRRNARRVGLQTPARGYVLTTAVLTAVALLVPLLSRVRSPGWLAWLHGLQVLWPGDLILRGTFPFLIIAAGLCVLAWAERSRALAAIAAVYTATALLSSLYDVANIAFRLGWAPSGREWDLTTLPNVLLPAFVLLCAGAGTFAVQRRQRARA